MYERYDRQIDIIGIDGQKKLARARVVVLGAGGLGSPVILYLAAVGIGRIIVIDSDRVSLTDLNRQVIYVEDDIGKKKVEVACERIKRLNSSIDIECLDLKFDEDNGGDIVKKADIIIDALDNWETRYTLNRLCVKHQKPFVHAGVYEWYGQLTTIMPGKTPCLQCIMAKPLPKRRIPVIGVTSGILGILEATEAIKYLLGLGQLLLGKLLIIDLLSNEFRIVSIRRNPSCYICGDKIY